MRVSQKGTLFVVPPKSPNLLRRSGHAKAHKGVGGDMKAFFIQEVHISDCVFEEQTQPP
jgi:hypothetical protein